MFTIITVAAVPSFFARAGECFSSRVYEEATAADVLRIARNLRNVCDRNGSRRYATVGIRVGDRRKSPVLWVR